MPRVPGTFMGPTPDVRELYTFWNGEPTPARQVRVRVAEAPEFEFYWARELVGTERDAVEVTYNGEAFYLDDEADPRDPKSEAGSGWAKVTGGHGSPSYGHRELAVEPESVVAR